MKRRKRAELGKTVRRFALGAFLVSLIPYRFRKDEETGTVEIRSLLWAWRKTPRGEGETGDRYAFAMPPSVLDRADRRNAAAAPGEPGAETQR